MISTDVLDIQAFDDHHYIINLFTEGEQLAQQYNAPYLEVSAFFLLNVDSLWQKTLQRLQETIDERPEPSLAPSDANAQHQRVRMWHEPTFFERAIDTVRTAVETCARNVTLPDISVITEAKRHDSALKSGPLI